MKNKSKKCKGTGKAIGHGCGEFSYNRKFGLCMPCYRVWLVTTEEGKEYIKKNTIRAKRKVEKENK